MTMQDEIIREILSLKPGSSMSITKDDITFYFFRDFNGKLSIQDEEPIMKGPTKTTVTFYYQLKSRRFGVLTND